MAAPQDLCPLGHALGPGKILNGWFPCMDCEWAREVGGHSIVRCQTCLGATGDVHRWDTVRFTPPHGERPAPGELSRWSVTPLNPTGGAT